VVDICIKPVLLEAIPDELRKYPQWLLWRYELSDVIIKKILKHLGLWLPKRSPPPARAHAPPKVVRIDYLDFQIPSADDYLIDPDYPTYSWTN
jgi:hypothetical protein